MVSRKISSMAIAAWVAVGWPTSGSSQKAPKVDDLPRGRADAPQPDAEPPDRADTNRGDGNRILRFKTKAFGSDAEVLIFSDDVDGARSAADDAFAEIARLEGLLSEAKTDSDLNRINRAAGGGAVEVSQDTVVVVEAARSVSQASRGAYSMTWAALADLWMFAAPPGQLPVVPSEESVRERLLLVGDDKLEVSETTVELPEAGMALSFGGIAKGYVSGQALGVLRAEGFENALVFIGGDIASSGGKGDTPWVVGLQEPRASGYFAVVALDEEAIATSGDYEHFFELEGRRYHHVIDPRTGFPAGASRSVTAISKDAATADAYATAVFVLGPRAGLALVEAIEGLEVVVVDERNQVIVSTGLADRLRILRQPAP